MKFREIYFQTEAESFSFLSRKTKVLFLNKILSRTNKIDPKDGVGTSMYYVSVFWGFFDPLTPPLSSNVSIWHDPQKVCSTSFPTFVLAVNL